jgi:hypothetical protein
VERAEIRARPGHPDGDPARHRRLPSA